MSSSEPVWLPEDGDIYLERSSTPHVRPHRPWWQGDVFAGVTIPLLLMKDGVPASKTLDNRFAMLLGHPCSIRGGARLAQIQNVVEVRTPRGKESDRLKPPWDSDFKLFPLPNLFGDHALYVGDFNVIGTVAADQLHGKRVACLNHVGWAAYQRRYAAHALRIEQPLQERRSDTQALWNEAEIWEEWCYRGQPHDGFPAWVREPAASGQYAGTSRLDLLEFAPDAVRAELPETG